MEGQIFALGRHYGNSVRQPWDRFDGQGFFEQLLEIPSLRNRALLAAKFSLGAASAPFCSTPPPEIGDGPDADTAAGRWNCHPRKRAGGRLTRVDNDFSSSLTLLIAGGGSRPRSKVSIASATARGITTLAFEHFDGIQKLRCFALQNRRLRTRRLASSSQRHRWMPQ